MFRFHFFLFLSILMSAQATASTRNTVRNFGDLGQHVVPIAAAGMSVYLKDFQGLKQYAFSSTMIMSAVYTVKYAVDRKRPVSGSCSFPSGHTASAFMGATYISRRYGMRYAWPFYMGAAYVGYSRVYAKKHYISDVMASVGLCVLLNHFLITPSCHHINLCPFLNSKRCGLSISYPIAP